jgi:mono/diheme cytochrome c family protein
VDGSRLTEPAVNRQPFTSHRQPLALVTALAVCISFTACRAPQKMASQPSYKPYEGSAFFEDGSSARSLVAGTVAQRTLREDAFLYTGKLGAELVDSFPFEMTAERLQRGRERYDIYCSMCHGRTGAGDGMIVQRGYKQPPSLHSPQLRARRVGHFFDVMTNGFGVMPSYASQVPVEDRWAIAAYVRVLQMSQNATMADVPADKRAELR